MEDSIIKDKNKIEDTLNELSNLKRYSNELANNTRGEKLENHINNLLRNITTLNDNLERIYEENYKNNE